MGQGLIIQWPCALGNRQHLPLRGFKDKKILGRKLPGAAIYTSLSLYRWEID